MNKKQMLTAGLTAVFCFFTATLSADIILENSKEIPKTEKNIMKAYGMNESTGTDWLYEPESNILAFMKPESVLMASTDIEKGTEDDQIELLLFSLQSEPFNLEETENEDAAVIDEAADTKEAEIISEQPLPTATPTEIPVKKAAVSFDKAVANVNESVNIRTSADANSKVVGLLYKDSYGIILERGSEWTKIASGNVTGYVNNSYLYFDQEAIDYLTSKEALTVGFSADIVNIRALPDTNSEVLGKAGTGSTYPAKPAESNDKWNAIEYNGQTAYVTAEFSNLKLTFKTARSIEEIEKQKKAEALAKALESAKNVKVGKTNRAAVTASDEEIYLLATVIASESLSESYEGKLAVANVVVNRLLKGTWGSSITSVLYAKGQFSGSDSGRFDRFAELVNEDCKKAAVEALAGVNNAGDFLYFISKGKANYSNYSKYYVLGGHVFYMP